MAQSEYFDQFGNYVADYGDATGVALETSANYLNVLQLSTIGIDAKLSGSSTLSLMSSTSYYTLSGIAHVGGALGRVATPLDLMFRAQDITNAADPVRETIAQAGDFAFSTAVGVGVTAGLVPVFGPVAPFIGTGYTVVADKSDIGRNLAVPYDAAVFTGQQASNVAPKIGPNLEQGAWSLFRAAGGGLPLSLDGPTECFPADTPIQLASGEFAPIQTIRAGDQVASFYGGGAGEGRQPDGGVNKRAGSAAVTSLASDGGNVIRAENFRGRGGSELSYAGGSHVPHAGGLDCKPVVRLFENITDTWIKLSWEDLGGEERSSLTTGATAPSVNFLTAPAEGPALAGSRERIKTLTVTPGHHFLDSKGGFRAIADILADDSQIVLADGTIASVSGEYIHYSAETADMFEQAEGYQPAHANQNISPPQSLYAI